MDRLDAVEARIDALERNSVSDLSDYLSIGFHNGKPAVIFKGANVMVVDGSGNTEGTTNGLGNLIVGYDEDPEQFGHSFKLDKSGSHNLVVGSEHTYSSYGGLVAGASNTVTGGFASVSGGTKNMASGYQSSVSGGFGNTASGYHASVSGGISNTVSGQLSSVSGGSANTASGEYSSVNGGWNNTNIKLSR